MSVPKRGSRSREGVTTWTAGWLSELIHLGAENSGLLPELYVYFLQSHRSTRFRLSQTCREHHFCLSFLVLLHDNLSLKYLRYILNFYLMLIFKLKFMFSYFTTLVINISATVLNSKRTTDKPQMVKTY